MRLVYGAPCPCRWLITGAHRARASAGDRPARRRPAPPRSRRRSAAAGVGESARADRPAPDRPGWARGEPSGAGAIAACGAGVRARPRSPGQVEMDPDPSAGSAPARSRAARSPARSSARSRNEPFTSGRRKGGLVEDLVGVEARGSAGRTTPGEATISGARFLRGVGDAVQPRWRSPGPDVVTSTPGPPPPPPPPPPPLSVRHAEPARRDRARGLAAHEQKAHARRAERVRRGDDLAAAMPKAWRTPWACRERPVSATRFMVGSPGWFRSGLRRRRGRWAHAAVRCEPPREAIGPLTCAGARPARGSTRAGRAARGAVGQGAQEGRRAAHGFPPISGTAAPAWRAAPARGARPITSARARVEPHRAKPRLSPSARGGSSSASRQSAAPAPSPAARRGEERG